MTPTTPLSRLGRITVAALYGVVVLSFCASTVTAGGPKDQPRPRGRALLREGYTRPGKPEDRISKAGILVSPALAPAEFFGLGKKGTVVGGTVYFAVFERVGTEGDVWGTGIENFDAKFVEGRNRRDQFSPGLDTKSKYLYLYQVVNDRGLYQWDGATFAALRDKAESDPVASCSVRLLVDPRYITSWGHFQAGFTFTVPDRSRSGELLPAKEGAERKKIRLAASSNPSIIKELPFLQYKTRSPAYPLRGDLKTSLALNESNLNLTLASAYKELKGAVDAGKIKPAAWEANLMQASQKGGREPNYVQLLYQGTAEAPEPIQGEDGVIYYSVFRADWEDKGAHLDLGLHSVVFGFTTDLPPTEQPLWLANPRASEALTLRAPGVGLAVGRGAGAGVVPAVAPGVGEGVSAAVAAGVAPGMGVSPAAAVFEAEAAPAAFGPSGVGAVGGQFGGVGGGFPGFGGVGGIGAGRGPATGAGGGTGGGTAQPGPSQVPGTTTTTGQAQTSTVPNQVQSQNITLTPSFLNQQGNQTNTNTSTNTNTNSNTQSQTQNQTQNQEQNQQQSQEQNVTPTPPSEVIPEPGAILLALLGLPVLVLLRRRKPIVNPAV